MGKIIFGPVKREPFKACHVVLGRGAILKTNKTLYLRFSPAVVQQLCKNFDNAQDLHGVRKIIESVRQTNASQLKDNVYKNYGQFIDTSKEITFLEAEM